MELVAHLLVGRGGKADTARLANRLKACGDVDPVAHQVAVGLLDHIAEMDAHADVDALIGRKAGVARNEAALNLNRRPHRLDHAAELDNRPVAGALDEPTVVDGDGRVDEVAAQRS